MFRRRKLFLAALIFLALRGGAGRWRADDLAERAAPARCRRGKLPLHFRGLRVRLHPDGADPRQGCAKRHVYYERKGTIVLRWRRTSTK